MSLLFEHGVNGLSPREEVGGARRDEMFALLSRHFTGVTREQFEHDLAEKNWVVEIREGDRLQGFTTLLVRETHFEGRVLTVIYSGDTIVAPEAWGSPKLARTWIAAVNALRAASPDLECYWVLLTSGYRTYRFLPVFWREFFPRAMVATPPHVQQLLDHLAREQYGEMYDVPTGLVRFPNPQQLAGVLGTVPAGRSEDDNVAYFLARNPGHACGDELACITQICEANMTAAGRRMAAPQSR